jgi:signal transduction histidine kinase
MSATLLPRALEPFSQEEPVGDPSDGGAGLGLPLARAYLEVLCARLELERRPGGGTVVWVRLPEDEGVGAEPSSSRAMISGTFRVGGRS